MSQGGWTVQERPQEVATDKYLPADLDQRGFALPLTTRPVAYARIRKGLKGLEIILPGFAEKLIAHVIPFEKLSEIVALNVFDRALLEEIKKRETEDDLLNTALIREISVSIGCTGIGGVGMMHRARAKRVILSNLEPVILNALTDSLVKSHGSSAAPAFINMSTDEGRAQALKELSKFASDNGTDSETIISRVEEIAKLMCRYRGPQKGMNGPIGTTLDNLNKLGDDLRQWLIPEPIEEAEMAQRTAIAAKEFVKMAKPYCDDLDLIYENIDGTVLNWNKLSSKMLVLIERLDMLIDGWERIMDAREKSMMGQRFVQRETLAEFAPFIPIPSKDIIGDDKEGWLELRTAQARWLGRINYIKDMKDAADGALQDTRMEIL